MNTIPRYLNELRKPARMNNGYISFPVTAKAIQEDAIFVVRAGYTASETRLSGIAPNHDWICVLRYLIRTWKCVYGYVTVSCLYSLSVHRIAKFTQWIRRPGGIIYCMKKLQRNVVCCDGCLRTARCFTFATSYNEALKK